MYLDILVFVIIIYTMVQGYRHGFVHTLLRTIGWLAAGVFGFLGYPKAAALLKENTDLYSFIHETVAGKLTGNAAAMTESAASHNMPAIIENAIDSAVNDAVTSLSDAIAGVILNIVAFLIIIAAVKLVLFFIMSLFSKKSNDGVIGGIDGFFGLIVGGVKGILIIFVMLMLLVPVTNLWGNPVLMDALDASAVARELYDNNLIFLVLKDML